MPPSCRARHPTCATTQSAPESEALGAHSFGLVVPKIGLNAARTHIKPPAGRLALISQSGALSRAVIDWATPNGVGFSHVIGLGGNNDIGFGITLDWLSSEGPAHMPAEDHAALTGLVVDSLPSTGYLIFSAAFSVAAFTFVACFLARSVSVCRPIEGFRIEPFRELAAKNQISLFASPTRPAALRR